MSQGGSDFMSNQYHSSEFDGSENIPLHNAVFLDADEPDQTNEYNT